MIENSGIMLRTCGGKATATIELPLSLLVLPQGEGSHITLRFFTAGVETD